MLLIKSSQWGVTKQNLKLRKSIKWGNCTNILLFSKLPQLPRTLPLYVSCRGHDLVCKRLQLGPERKQKTQCCTYTDIVINANIISVSTNRPSRLQPRVELSWVLLYVNRNRRFIRDGSPGRPPRLSHSSWALSAESVDFWVAADQKLGLNRASRIYCTEVFIVIWVRRCCCCCFYMWI